MRRAIGILTVVVLIGMWTAAGAVRAADLEAGLAVVDITPPIGYRMCGYFNERVSTGIHDPLHAKALVFRQGGQQAALVLCDLIAMSLEVAEPACRAAAVQTGIPAEHIIIAATHSHTGPLFHGTLHDYFHQRAVEAHGSDPQEKLDYPAWLAQRIAQAVAQGHAALQPISLAAGVATQEHLAFNRRFHMKDGSVRFNPGKMNPDIVHVAGPTDPGLPIVLLRGPGGPLACLTSFALHLDTTGGTLYSADYPYYLEESLRTDFGPKFISLFGTGACGDINHIDVSTKAVQKGGEEARRIGQTLAGTVKAALPSLAAVDAPALAVRQRTVEFPLQEFTADELAQATAALPLIGTAKMKFLDQVHAVTTVDLKLYRRKTLAMSVQAVRLNRNVALVALPGEIFVELGLAIKRASPFAVTMVVELSQQCPGYVPTQKAYGEGSYEIVNSRLKPGGGEALAQAAIELLKELRE